MGKHKKDARSQYLKKRKKNKTAKRRIRKTEEPTVTNQLTSVLSSDIELTGDSHSECESASDNNANTTAVHTPEPGAKNEDHQDYIHCDPLYIGLQKLNKYKLKVRQMEIAEDLSWRY